VREELEALESKKQQAAEAEENAKKEAEEAEFLRVERRKTVPMQLFEFGNGRRAVAAMPSSLLTSSTKQGRRLVREILATLGLDIGLVGATRATELRAACPWHLRRP